MQLAVLGDQANAAIGEQPLVEGVCRIVTDCADLQAEAIGVAHTLRAQLVLHRPKEIEEYLPRIRNVRSLEAGLFDQVPPYMEWDDRRLVRYPIKASPLCDPIIAISGKQRIRMVFRLLRLDDIADILPFILPGELRLIWMEDCSIRSGTTPLVTAEIVFWRNGANGMMLR